MRTNSKRGKKPVALIWKGNTHNSIATVIFSSGKWSIFVKKIRTTINIMLAVGMVFKAVCKLIVRHIAYQNTKLRIWNE